MSRQPVGRGSRLGAHSEYPTWSGVQGAGAYLGEMIGNVPGSAAEVGSDLWEAVSSPIDTAKAISGAAVGGVQLAKDALGIPSPGLFGEHRDTARAVGDYYGDRYGGGQEFLDSLRTDPVGVGLDVGGLLTGGAGAAARLPGVAGRLARAITHADPVAAGGRAVAAGGRVAEQAIQARRSTPSTKQFIADAPGPEALRSQGSALFEAAEASGVRFKTGPFGEFADSLLARLIDEGADDILTPKVARIANVLEQSKGRAPSIQQMSILRRQFGNAAGSADRAEARIGSIAIDLLDDFVESGAGHVGGQLSEARTMWGRLKKSEIIDSAIENAQAAQAGVEAGLRKEFRTLYKARGSKRMRGFTDAELAAMKSVAEGNFGANVLRRIGSLAGGLDQGRNMLNLLGGVGAGAYVGGPIGAVAVPALAYGAARMSKKGTQNRAAMARAIAARGEVPTPTSAPGPLVVDQLLAQGAARRYRRGVAPVAVPVAVGAERSKGRPKAAAMIDAAKRKSDQASTRGGDAIQTGEPMRPCARCRRKFQPNLKRRMLCLGCFKGAESFAEPRHYGPG